MLIAMPGRHMSMTELEAERNMSRVEVAEYLRQFADKLDTSDSTRPTGAHSTIDIQDESDEDNQTQAGDEAATGETESSREWSENERETATEESPSAGKMTFMVGNESTTINPPDTVTFEMMVDSDSSLIGSETGRTASFTLHWDDADVSKDDEMSIQ